MSKFKTEAREQLCELAGGAEIRDLKNSINTIIFVFLIHKHDICLDAYNEDFYSLMVIYNYLDSLEKEAN